MDPVTLPMQAVEALSEAKAGAHLHVHCLYHWCYWECLPICCC